jgi:hypothetical protein
MTEARRGTTFLAFAAIAIIAGVALAGYVVDSQVIVPASQSIGYPPVGNVTITNQSSVELFYTTGSSFSMNSTLPVNVFIYIAQPSSFKGLYQLTNISVTKMSTSFPVSGDIYIVISNPGTQNVTVFYRET